MEKRPLELFEVTRELAILKVNADDALTVARNPWLSSDWEYVTITRGDRHTITAIRKDGTRAASFSFGEGGCDLVGDELLTLESKVVDVLNGAGVPWRFHTMTEPDGVRVFYSRTRRANNWVVRLTCSDDRGFKVESGFETKGAALGHVSREMPGAELVEAECSPYEACAMAGSVETVPLKCLKGLQKPGER